MATDSKCLAVVRVRGVGDASPEIERTLEILRLNRNCQITFVDSRPSFTGMLKKARNFVTWGEVTKESILLLLKERGRLVGNKKLDNEYAKRAGYGTLEDLANAIYELKVDFLHLPDMKPVFRAHPPKRGYRGKIRRSFSAGGVIGYRGKAINELIVKMV